MNEQIEVFLWMGGAIVCYLTLLFGWPRWRHRLIHRWGQPYGRPEIWRRPADQVQMVGFRCPECGKLTGIHPQAVSYRRMLRGERYY